MLLLAGSLFVLQRYYGGELIESATAVLQAEAEAAAVLWQQEDTSRLRRWLHRRSDRLRLALVDENGASKFRKPLPHPLRRALPRPVTVGTFDMRGGKVMLIAALPGVSPKLFLVTDIHTGRLRAMPFWVRVVLTVLIFGLVSFLLARMLTRQVHPLRIAAQRMAEGDLSVRVESRGKDEISALGVDFNLMAERLNDLLQSQRRLVRDVSHELRSPLARLRVALELAERADDPKKALQRIEKEADELERLTTEVLSLARLESGQGVWQRQPLQLDELIARVVTDAEFEAHAQGKQVAFSSTPITLNGDAVLLRSAVENVVRNAIRHTPEGTSVDVSMKEEPGTCVISVRDAGRGVSDEQLQTMFDPFTRTGEARDRGSGGFGLGLAIARRALQVHEGELEARNLTDGGLEVQLRLLLSE